VEVTEPRIIINHMSR